MPSNSLYTLYPEISPYHATWIDRPHGHKVYVEISGNPHGKPIIFLHGGPGGGTNPKQRQFFDPTHYQIILFDQRGCGQSKPLGEVNGNTTADLISDMEAIREHLHIKHWIIFGGSWGSALALAYANQYPQTIKALILRGIFLSRETELNWFLDEVKAFFLEAHRTLLHYLPEDKRDDLIKNYSALVFSNDLKISGPASIAWNQFEGGLLKLLPQAEENKTLTDEDIQNEIARARVQLHYIKDKCFIDGKKILEEVKKLKDVPTTIIQGRYDMVCPPITAYELHQHMPHADFIMVPDAGHSASEPSMTHELIKATNNYRILS
ncbi:MhpC Predicted hydrolases or acyltransferases (alpha/beta hydrolase superfamily) [Candidatus Methylopumilus universalis]|uniref:prolyl aminopeptidase n=1 Tax=Candidatus Methylopumilus universalis TaxID=2588536 RepID=UPI003BEEB6A3